MKSLTPVINVRKSDGANPLGEKSVNPGNGMVGSPRYF
jgi:hypothetical protein